MEITNPNNNPPPKLETELREKTARLQELEILTNNLQSIIETGRQESDFDLFYRRLKVAENLSSFPPEAMWQLHLTELYFEFWRLAGESQRKTKFSDEEKNISQQILNHARQEKNPIRQQYLALALIVFGELPETLKLINQNLWSPQLKEDFATFMKWSIRVNNPLTPNELAREACNEQILNFLQQKYSALIKKYSQAVIDEKTCPRVLQENYQIYFCWFQGEENLPLVVRCCYNSLKQNAEPYKIVFIDEKNLSQYVDIAPHIMDKFKAGKITRTHFSDILRVNLLERYGGLWLDSTVLVTEPLKNYKNFWQLPFFSAKICNEKNIFSSLRRYVPYSNQCLYSGFIQGTSILHNPLYSFGKEFFNFYWQEFDELIDYFLIDFMIVLAYNNIPAVCKEIDDVPINNKDMVFIHNHRNDLYLAYPYDKLTNNFLHKLNWKVPPNITLENTVFREIQRRYAPETIQ